MAGGRRAKFPVAAFKGGRGMPAHFASRTRRGRPHNSTHITRYTLHSRGVEAVARRTEGGGSMAVRRAKASSASSKPRLHTNPASPIKSISSRASPQCRVKRERVPTCVPYSAIACASPLHVPVAPIPARQTIARNLSCPRHPSTPQQCGRRSWPETAPIFCCAIADRRAIWRHIADAVGRKFYLVTITDGRAPVSSHVAARRAKRTRRSSGGWSRPV
jgi:hypothetical protein